MGDPTTLIESGEVSESGKLIDLGELGGGPPNPPPLPRRGRPQVPRWAVTLALAAVVGATVVGSAPGAALAQVFAVDIGSRDAAVADDDNLYTVTRGSPTALVAYRRADGAVRWRRAVPTGLAHLQSAGARVVLVSGRCTDRSDAEATRFDAATGQPRWTRPGQPAFATAGGRVVLVHREQPSGCGSDDGGVPFPPLDTTAVGADSGTPAWSLRFGWTDQVALADTEDFQRLVVARADGTVQVWNTISGTIVASARIADFAAPADRADPAAAVPGTPAVVGDLLISYRQDGADVVVRAYRLDTLAELWQVRVPREVYPAPASVLPCGSRLCLTGEQIITALDPATGRQIWRRDGTLVAARDGAVLAEGREALLVLDAGSGRDLAVLVGWHLLAELRPRHGVPLAFRVTGGRTQLAAIDLSAAALRYLGAVPGGLAACELRGRRLLCTTPDGMGRGLRVVS